MPSIEKLVACTGRGETSRASLSLGEYNRLARILREEPVRALTEVNSLLPGTDPSDGG